MEKEIIKEILIVLITYNSEDFIENCINSIIESTNKNWFLQILDNNSRDSTNEKIKRIRENSEILGTHNFNLISLKKNIGFAPAVNYAVSDFKKNTDTNISDKIRFLLFLNPDLILDKFAINNLVSSTISVETGSKTAPVISNSDESNDGNQIDYLTAENRIGVMGGIIYDYERKKIQNAGGKISGNYITSHLEKAEGSIYQSDYVSGALFFTRLEYFLALSGLDPGYRPVYFEELDFCLKLKKLELQTFINSQVTAVHYEGASVGKFSIPFYRYYHKNRIRCAVINGSLLDFFKKFLPAEIFWVRKYATMDQKSAILAAYFLNFLFLPYNLVVKIRNKFLISDFNKKISFARSSDG